MTAPLPPEVVERLRVLAAEYDRSQGGLGEMGEWELVERAARIGLAAGVEQERGRIVDWIRQEGVRLGEAGMTSAANLGPLAAALEARWFTCPTCANDPVPCRDCRRRNAAPSGPDAAEAKR